MVDETQYQAMASFDTPIEEVKGIKARMKELGNSSSDLWKIKVDTIHELPNFNMRLDSPDYTAHIEYLKNSIDKNDYFPDAPVTCILAKGPDGDKTIYMIDGHSRLRAVRELKAEGRRVVDVLPGIMKMDARVSDLLAVSYHQNNGRKKYTPLETALVALRMRELDNLEDFQISERLGITLPYTRDLLNLAKGPADIRAMVQDGKVTASVAIETMRKRKEDAERVLKEAVARKEAEAKRAAEAEAKAQAQAEERSRKAAAPATTPVDTRPTTTATAPDDTAKQPSAGTVVKAPAPAPAPAPKPVRVTSKDVDPVDKTLAEQQRLGPRLYQECKRLEKEGKLVVTAELEKIFWTIEEAGRTI